MDVKKLEKRLYAFLGFVIFVFIVLTIGLSALQIVKGDEYEKLAEENRIRLISLLHLGSFRIGMVGVGKQPAEFYCILYECKNRGIGTRRSI